MIRSSDIERNANRALALETMLLAPAAHRARSRTSPAHGRAPARRIPLVVGIRFRPAGQIYDFDPGGLLLQRDDRVLVETERGPDARHGRRRRRPARPASRPLQRVVKKADARDLAREDRTCSASASCTATVLGVLGARGVPREAGEGRERVRRQPRDASSSPPRSGSTSATLARDLAEALHTRIEIKQIGARDETKLAGGVGVCGRELCCSSWLREFQPVSVKMAKAQGLSLNPSKLAGQCGRLKCCLRYEYQTYLELQARPAGRRRAGGEREGQRQVVAPEPAQADGDRPARRRRRAGRGDARRPGRQRRAGCADEPLYFTTPLYYVERRAAPRPHVHDRGRRHAGALLARSAGATRSSSPAPTSTATRSRRPRPRPASTPQGARRPRERRSSASTWDAARPRATTTSSAPPTPTTCAFVQKILRRRPRARRHLLRQLRRPLLLRLRALLPGARAGRRPVPGPPGRARRRSPRRTTSSAWSKYQERLLRAARGASPS